MVVTQSVWGQLLDAITLGVIFARISHPKQRARTLFMSDSAVIARRDGVLKFMVRIGDIRNTQVRGFGCMPLTSTEWHTVMVSTAEMLLEACTACMSPVCRSRQQGLLSAAIIAGQACT